MKYPILGKVCHSVRCSILCLCICMHACVRACVCARVGACKVCVHVHARQRECAQSRLDFQVSIQPADSQQRLYCVHSLTDGVASHSGAAGPETMCMTNSVATVASCAGPSFQLVGENGGAWSCTPPIFPRRATSFRHSDRKKWPPGAHNFQTGVPRRKYKLGSTKR